MRYCPTILGSSASRAGTLMEKQRSRASSRLDRNAGAHHLEAQAMKRLMQSTEATLKSSLGFYGHCQPDLVFTMRLSGAVSQFDSVSYRQ